MTVVYLYTEEWNFVRSVEGMTEQDAISKVPEDFKGYAVVQGEKRKQYHFKQETKMEKNIPEWLSRAIHASEDFHYGIEREIKEVWENPTLTELQKQCRIDRLMVNARNEKWAEEPIKRSTKTSTGRRFR